MEVVVDTVCSSEECGKGLGKYHLVCEELLLSSPKNRQPKKNKNYTLTDLFLHRLVRHVDHILGLKVRCTIEACSGRAKHRGILHENLKIPPFLFLNFHVVGNPNNYHNYLKDSCMLEENIHLGKHSLKLLCGLMVTQLHFFSICIF